MYEKLKAKLDKSNSLVFKLKAFMFFALWGANKCICNQNGYD